MGNCLGKKESNVSEDDDIHDLYKGNVCVITSKEIWDEKIAEANRENKIVVVNFSAAWCGPCRAIGPLYSDLSEKFPLLLFLTIDVDELTDLSSSWDVRATPTFFFLSSGKQIDKLVGANKSELEKKVALHADSAVVE